MEKIENFPKKKDNKLIFSSKNSCLLAFYFRMEEAMKRDHFCIAFAPRPPPSCAQAPRPRLFVLYRCGFCQSAALWCPIKWLRLHSLCSLLCSAIDGLIQQRINKISEPKEGLSQLFCISFPFYFLTFSAAYCSSFTSCATYSKVLIGNAGTTLCTGGSCTDTQCCSGGQFYSPFFCMASVFF